LFQLIFSGSIKGIVKAAGRGELRQLLFGRKGISAATGFVTGIGFVFLQMKRY
jgi:hypothetical protein